MCLRAHSASDHVNKAIQTCMCLRAHSASDHVNKAIRTCMCLRAHSALDHVNKAIRTCMCLRAHSALDHVNKAIRTCMCLRAHSASDHLNTAWKISFSSTTSSSDCTICFTHCQHSRVNGRDARRSLPCSKMKETHRSSISFPLYKWTWQHGNSLTYTAVRHCRRLEHVQ